MIFSENLMKTTKFIHTLNFAGNKISDEGAKFFAQKMESLKFPPFFVFLCIFFYILSKNKDNNHISVTITQEIKQKLDLFVKNVKI